MDARTEVAVVVPVKGGPLAKSRLDLPHGDRLALADAFARDTVAAVRAGAPAATVLVVTADAQVARWAAEAGCVLVPDPGGGLDAAVAAGVAVAGRAGDPRVVVLLADHPALHAAEVALALQTLPCDVPVLVPDAGGTGTALLGLPAGDLDQRPTRFGPGSAAAHASLGYVVCAPELPGLRTDVDDTASLAAAMRLGVGPHTRAAVAHASLPSVQATIHRPPGSGASGSALLDDGVEVQVPPGSVADSGVLHLRAGQRVSIELDDSGRVATRVWIVGIGPSETIR